LNCRFENVALLNAYVIINDILKCTRNANINIYDIYCFPRGIHNWSDNFNLTKIISYVDNMCDIM